MGSKPNKETKNSLITNKKNIAQKGSKQPSITKKQLGVDAADETYDGKYFVDEVTHSFSKQGYRSSFKLKRNTAK